MPHSPPAAITAGLRRVPHSPPVAISAGLVVLAAVIVVLTLVLRSGGEHPAVAQASVPSSTIITVAWVGDTMLGHDGALPPQGGRELFAPMRPWLRSADLMLGNLEGVLATTGGSKCAGSKSGNCFAFRAPPSSAAALRWAGFDAMNLANNHAMDYGAGGLEETAVALRDNGIASTGRPGEITLMRVRGTRIALIGLAPYPWAQSSLDLAGAAALVRTARTRADVVIAMIHAGAEGSGQTHTPAGREVAFGEDRGDTRALAHTLVDAGAALVLGSGPHVVRGLERRNGRLIAYSLGNFAGWHNFAGGPVLDQTGVLRLRITPDGRVQGGRWVSAQMTPPGIPQRQRSNISAQLARSVSLTDFGATAWPMTGRGRLGAWNAAEAGARSGTSQVGR
ncbi:CapA family protein [Capillimicrobium parvum]|uniref:CapA family protein n=1 Tax=Capillimicrobium parvum TaxID=2884022 RepID=UPI00216AECD3|nr:CapA family protein [Capillimicrobium parvum]